MGDIRLKISQLNIHIGHSDADLLNKAAKTLGVPTDKIKEFKIVKQSIDARDKQDLKYSYVVSLTVDSKCRIKNNKNITRDNTVIFDPVLNRTQTDKRIAIAGAGPAGLFCAYVLALNGYKPVIYERGKSVSERTEDVEKFWETGLLDTSSNVQFGEGGAGTFSDGKLNTLVKDKYGYNRFVLDTFVKFGADEEISYTAKPHIGTDVLAKVIVNIREEIKRLGGEIYFKSQITDIFNDGNLLKAIVINNQEKLEIENLVLAIGHSARDTFEMLDKKAVPMEPKAFAVGFRVEHPQSMINVSQYGDPEAARKLSAAPYKLTYNSDKGRGVYSFCMCPGGYVVNASSEDGMLAVNGMSYKARDGENANSAIIMTIKPEEYGFTGENNLCGVEFQRNLERKAYEAGNGKIPQQLFSDYKSGRVSASYGAFESTTKGHSTFADLSDFFSADMKQDFIDGMNFFGRKLKGFDRDDAILSGIESRTSSPVRIIRNEDMMSDIKGIYPCGEGAGYAGGIMSAAIDGIKVALAIIENNK